MATALLHLDANKSSALCIEPGSGENLLPRSPRRSGPVFSGAR